MIVNEDCLHMLAELTIDRLIADGIQSAWSGDYQINLLKGNIDIIIDVKLKEIGDHGVSMDLVYQDKIHLAAITIKDCRMFNREHAKMEFSQWQEHTTAMLVHNYSRWLVQHFIETDLYVGSWFCELRKAELPASMVISGFLFESKLKLNTGWFQVDKNNTTIYRIERSNHLNMTTKQGWQALNLSGIRSEMLRTISTLLTTRSEFKIPVEL